MDEELNDLYDFEFLNDKTMVFIYKNENTGGNIVSVELSSHQRIIASKWMQKAHKLESQKNDLIKSWLGI